LALDLEGQGAQQDGIDHRKDGSVGPDAEAEGEDSDNRENQIAPAGPQGKAKILKKAVQHSSSQS
jgi:hypothetical protein